MNRKMRRAAQSRDKRVLASPAAATDSDFISKLVEHGWQLVHEQRDQDAMEVAERAIRLRQTDASKALFVHCLKQWSYFPGAADLRDVLALAVMESWAPIADLRGAVMGIFQHDAAIGPAMARACAAWPRRLPLPDLLGERGVAALSRDELLLAFLKVGTNVNFKFERLLTSIRAGLLNIAIRDDGGHDDGALPLCCALASQCFISEYIFDLTVDELTGVGELRDQISNATVTGAAISPLTLAVLAAYEPLDRLPENKMLLKRQWPRAVSDLLHHIISEPAAERRQRDSIPRVTPITDPTSLRVQKQYEENPYPRWVSFPTAASSLSVDESFTREFPFSRYRSTGKTGGCDMLIAGCGTGRHCVRFAQGFPSARILAVDLSLVSLGYAKHKTIGMGLKKIEYAQADILELDRMGRTFDIVSSAGVLHHLADPCQAWRKLLSLLRPDGCMHIGLYSELARQNIVAVQNWLHERAYTASVDDIRRARQTLMGDGAEEPLGGDLLESWDFFTTSECRDLLFPSQERRFTIPQIKAFLDENNLEFIGFLIDTALREKFARRFSREQEADLDLWHLFENENPHTFRAMYEFWVQKRPS
jgi:SAM-dependent methyltransferase